MKNNLILIFLYALSFSASCQHPQKKDIKEIDKSASTVLEIPSSIQLITMSDQDWKNKLDEQTYYVMREQGTERAFTGKYWDNHQKGIYLCNACQLPLFTSETKFESGTGWPSFYDPLRKDVVTVGADNSHGMVRDEVVCSRCKGHLGHVFNDGPKPTGLRNTAAISRTARAVPRTVPVTLDRPTLGA